MTVKWSESLKRDICDHLTTGKSILDIAKLQGYPSSDSMYREMAKDEEFAAAIARAREAGQDHEADACVQMADAATGEDWQVVKLRIWARQWRAGKLAPKKYGDSTTLRHADANGEKIQPDDISVVTRLASLATTLAERLHGSADEPS